MKDQPLVNPEEYGGQHPKYKSCYEWNIWRFFHFVIISWFNWSGILIWKIFWGILKWIIWRINLYITIINETIINYTHDSKKKGILLGGEVWYFKWTYRVCMFQSLGGSVGLLPWSVFKWLIFIIILGDSNLGPWMMHSSSLCPIIPQH